MAKTNEERAKLIKAWMDANDLNIARMARKSGLHRNTIANLIYARHKPDLKTVIQLVDCMDIKASQLI